MASQDISAWDTEAKKYINANWGRWNSNQRRMAMARYEEKKRGYQTEAEQSLARSDAKKAEQRGNIAMAGAVFGAPIAQKAGDRVAGLLGLGEEALASKAPGIAAQTLPAIATPTSLPAITQGANLGMGAPANAVASAISGPGEFLTAGGGITGASSPWSLAGAGSAGNLIGPAGGLMGLGELFANKRHGGRGAAQGALSGAAMGSYFGPVGAVAGGVLGGAAGYFGDFGDKDRWKEEGDRLRKLEEQGVTPLVTDAMHLTEGRPEEAGNKPKSGTDLIGFAAPLELLGNDYRNASHEQRVAFMDKVYNSPDLWSYHHGQLDFKDPERAKELWNEVMGGAPQSG